VLIFTRLDKVGYGYTLPTSPFPRGYTQRVQLGEIRLSFYGKRAFFGQIRFELV